MNEEWVGIVRLGVSNQVYNAQRGFGYGRPVAFMRDYLAKMKDAPYEAPKPPHSTPIVVAAMMPKMLQLAASETNGTLTYAIVAWGDEGRIRQRIADQFETGATHVCMIPLNPRGGRRPDERAIDALAPR